MGEISIPDSSFRSPKKNHPPCFVFPMEDENLDADKKAEFEQLGTLRYYALFDYNDSTINIEDIEEEENLSLTVICSDVPAILETELKNLLSQKLIKNAVYCEAGSVSQFDLNLHDTVNKWSCYYCMVKEKEVREDGGNVKYIVCFLAPEAEMLEMKFSHDLDLYCVNLSQEISNKTVIAEAASQYLQQWHEKTLDFLCRCVHLLQQDIKYLLFCALIDGRLEFNGGEESVHFDLIRFVKLCNMSDIFGRGSSGSIDMLVDLSSAGKPQQKLPVKFEDGKPIFQQEGCSKFCEHWSKAINSVDKNSPGEIRQAVEAFRAKFIHSINTLKRLLMEAQTDYYAYYRTYKFILSSGNSDVLLNYAYLDESTEVKDVFTDLKKYIVQHC